MQELELIYFQIISSVGTARSIFIEAIQQAKAGDYDEAKASMEEGIKYFIEGHKTHTKLLQKEARNEKVEFSLLLVHAEDQLMSADAFKILATEFIDVYRRFDKVE